MNPEQQKNHKRVTDALATQISGLVDATDETFREMDRDLREAISAERTHRLKLADEQRGYVDAADQTLHRALRGVEEVMDARLRAIESMSFLARMRWFFTGRIPPVR